MSARSVDKPRLSFERWDGALSWVILSTNLRVRRHQFRVAVSRHPGRIALQTFVVIPMLFLVGLLLFAGIAGGMTAAASDDAATAILTTLLTLTVVAAFIGSSTTALQSLYLSNDLAFLQTLPVPLRVLYGNKFIAAMGGTIPAALFGFIALTAYGVTRADQIFFLPAALLAEAIVILLATNSAVIVVALVTRAIPARRARIFLFSISLTIVAITILLWNAIAPSQQHLGMTGADQQIVAMGEAMTWLPTSWLAQGVAAAGSGDLRKTVGTITDAIALTVVGLVLSYQVFARSFSKGVASVRATATSRPSQTRVRRLSLLTEPMPAEIGALVVKEWLTIFRDLKRLSGVIWPLGVVAIYSISASRSTSGESGSVHFWQSNASLALLPWAISLGLSIYAFGSEGNAVHLLRLLPVSPRRLFAAKVLAAAFPIVVVSEIIAGTVAMLSGGTWLDVIGMIVLVAWTSIGFVTIDTAASAIAPNFEADQIQRSTALVGRVVGMTMGAVFALSTALAALRLILYTIEPPLGFQEALAWEIAGVHPLGVPTVLLGLAGATLTVFLATKVAVDRLDDLIRNGP